MRTFKVGDKVTWCGIRGVVVKTSYEGDQAVSVDFGDAGIKSFTEDGKSKPYYMNSSLKLLEREGEKDE